MACSYRAGHRCKIKIPPTSFPSLKQTTQILFNSLSDENFRLRQIIDEMANTLAIQQELIQQLRDEIANLKGQKPKPKIPPSKLEGPKSKPDWRKRIGPHDPQMKSVVFSSWVRGQQVLVFRLCVIASRR